MKNKYNIGDIVKVKYDYREVFGEPWYTIKIGRIVKIDYEMRINKIIYTIWCPDNLKYRYIEEEHIVLKLDDDNNVLRNGNIKRNKFNIDDKVSFKINTSLGSCISQIQSIQIINNIVYYNIAYEPYQYSWIKEDKIYLK